MTEKDKLPTEYLEGFNNGYRFSKEFPDSTLIFTQNIPIQSNEDSNLTSSLGMHHGFGQGLKELELDNNAIHKTEIENIDRIRGNGFSYENDKEL